MPQSNQNRRNLKKKYEFGSKIDNPRIFSEIKRRLMDNNKGKEEKVTTRGRKRKRSRKKQPSVKVRVIGIKEMDKNENLEKVEKGGKEIEAKKLEKKTEKEKEKESEKEECFEGKAGRNLMEEWAILKEGGRCDVKSGILTQSLKQENLTEAIKIKNEVQKIKYGHVQKKKTSSPRVKKSKGGKIVGTNVNVKKITAYFETIGNGTAKNEIRDSLKQPNLLQQNSGWGVGGGPSSVQARGGIIQGKSAATHGRKPGIMVAGAELKD